MPDYKLEEFIETFKTVFKATMPSEFECSIAGENFTKGAWDVELSIKILSCKGKPRGRVTDSDFRKTDEAVEKALRILGVVKDWFFYMGVDESDQTMHWYTYHPEIPAEDIPADTSTKDMMQFIPRILSPTARVTSSGAIFLILDYQNYDAIENGSKTVEYRTYSQNYVNRIFGARLDRVLFQRGYGAHGEKPKQMQVRIEGVSLLDDETGVEMEAYGEDGRLKGEESFPVDFRPTRIAIHLGGKLNVISISDLLEKTDTVAE